MNAAPSKLTFRSKWTLMIVSMALIAGTWTHALDEMASEQVTRSLVHASAVFALARTLNGVLTVAKSTELGMGFISFQPLEVLDPIHDLVEHFSSLMLMATISLTIQQLLLMLSAMTSFKIMLTVVTMVFVAAMLFNWIRVLTWAWRFMLFAILVRFLLLAAVLSNAFFETSLLHEQTISKEDDIRVLSEEFARIGDTHLPSAEKREKLLDEARTLKDRNIKLERKLDGTQGRITQLERKQSQVKVEIEEAPRGRFGRRILDDDLQARRESVESDIRVQKELKSSILQERNTVTDRLEGIDAELSGRKESSFLSPINERFQTFRDLMRVASLKERSEELVDGITFLMALFLLRTVILPLLFLLVFTKALKRLWQIDLVDELRRLRPSTHHDVNGRSLKP